jgi:hypothetical protein
MGCTSTLAWSVLLLCVAVVWALAPTITWQITRSDFTLRIEHNLVPRLTAWLGLSGWW